MAENVLEITDANFQDEVISGSGLTMVDFWAEWCGPCRIIAPVVEELAREYGDKGLRVGKLDVDNNPQISGMLGIRSIPTVLFFKDGQVVDRVIGAMPKPVFAQKIESHL